MPGSRTKTRCIFLIINRVAVFFTQSKLLSGSAGATRSILGSTKCSDLGEEHRAPLLAIYSGRTSHGVQWVAASSGVWGEGQWVPPH